MMVDKEERKPKRKPTTRRGRPKGSKTKERDVVAADHTRCRQCGSENRTPYANSHAVEVSAVRCLRCPLTGPKGRDCGCGGRYELPFSRVVLRRTSCKDCGQARFDKYWET